MAITPGWGIFINKPNCIIAQFNSIFSPLSHIHPSSLSFYSMGYGPWAHCPLHSASQTPLKPTPQTPTVPRYVSITFSFLKILFHLPDFLSAPISGWEWGPSIGLWCQDHSVLYPARRKSQSLGRKKTSNPSRLETQFLSNGKTQRRRGIFALCSRCKVMTTYCPHGHYIGVYI